MKIYLTLDYELFLLEPAEDINQSLLQPTLRFHNLLKKYNSRAVYFVDAGYLFALDRQKDQFGKIQADYEKIVQQIQFLSEEGNEIGLHIHPHWEDCYFDGKAWKMDLRRYKLADFTREEAAAIFKKYYYVLQSVSPGKIISFRAGGWCLEPFGYIRDAMIECGISIDSSVYFGGYSRNDTHSYDFRTYPEKDSWRFSIDPSVEDVNGNFLEMPFASYQLRPSLFWKVLLSRMLNILRNKEIGQGVQPTVREVLNKLFLKTTHAVSMDSIKSEVLLPSFKHNLRSEKNNYCIIGHPKCFTELTYINLEQFIQYALKTGNTISTFSELDKQENGPVYKGTPRSLSSVE